MVFDKTSTEFLGLSSCHKSIAKTPNIINEVVLRLGVKSQDKNIVARFTKELAPLHNSRSSWCNNLLEADPDERDSGILACIDR